MTQLNSSHLGLLIKYFYDCVFLENAYLFDSGFLVNHMCSMSCSMAFEIFLSVFNKKKVSCCFCKRENKKLSHGCSKPNEDIVAKGKHESHKNKVVMSVSTLPSSMVVNSTAVVFYKPDFIQLIYIYIRVIISSPRLLFHDERIIPTFTRHV